MNPLPLASLIATLTQSVVATLPQPAPRITIQWERGCPLTGFYLSNYNTYEHTQTDLGYNYSNIYSAVVRSTDLRLPVCKWQLVALTNGTNYSEPMTNTQYFYRVFNTNIATGERESQY